MRWTRSQILGGSVVGVATAVALVVPAGLASAHATRWRVRATPVVSGQLRPHLAAVSCASPAARCIAVGGHLNAAGRGFAVAESWNGTRWRLSPIPSPGSQLNDLYGLSCSSATHCVAVGETGVQHTSSYLWNGSRWSPLPTPSP